MKRVPAVTDLAPPAHPRYIRHMTWTLPNVLTVLRLLAAPCVALAFLFAARPWADYAALILFIVAAATDWIDGYLARAWKQETKFGAMLDPIADKAMVLIALMVVVALFGLDLWVLIPATLIAFREVFVSGLREYMGSTVGHLRVSNLAKWKTTIQMTAIVILLSSGIFEHYLIVWTFGMGEAMAADVLAGREQDVLGLRWVHAGMIWSWYGGVLLLWLAAVLTLVTGWDYFRKSLPHLREDA